MATRVICAKCGSPNVLIDAWAVSDVIHQDWLIRETFDYHGFCRDCDNETSIREITVDK
jgi:hypothetical protein